MRAWSRLDRPAHHSALIADAGLRDAANLAVGFVVTALLPALFWTAVLALGGSLAGQPLSAGVLLSAGTAIAAFLSAVYLTLSARAA